MASLDDLAASLSPAEAKTLRKVLGQIGAPDNDLFNLAGVLSELVRILPLLPRGPDGSAATFSQEVIDGLPIVAGSVTRLSADQRFATMRSPDAQRTEPMFGYIKQYPIYSMLPYRCVYRDHSERHDALKAQVFAAALNLRTTPLCGPVVKSGTYSVRWLRANEVINRFPATPMSAAAYRDRVHDILLTRGLAVDEESHVSEVRRLLECAIQGYGRFAHDWIDYQRTPQPKRDKGVDDASPGGERERQRATDDASREGRANKHELQPASTAARRRHSSAFRTWIEGDGDPLRPEPGAIVERPPATSGTALEKALASGLAPGDLGADHEFLTEEEEVRDEPLLPPVREKSVARQAASLRNRLVQMERSAQLLPGTWARLAPAEVAYGLRELRLWLHAARRSAIAAEHRGGASSRHGAPTVPISEELQSEGDAAGSPLESLLPNAIAEAGAVIVAMLWLSKPLDDALRLRLYATQADAEREARTLHVGYILDARAWVMPVIRPKGEPAYHGTDFTLAESVAQVLVLPDAGAGWAYLHRLPHWATVRPGAPVNLVTVGSSAIGVAVDEFFLRCSAGTDRRITATRWRDTLLHLVMDRTGDAAAASAMFARLHYLADTQLHYTLFNATTLAEVYRQTCDDLIETMLAELAASDKRLVPIDPRTFRGARSDTPVPRQGITIGSPICPRETNVRRLVGGLRELAAAANASAIELQELLDLHNALTAYLCWLLRFGTGYRDAATPIPLPSDLDLDGRLMMVSDKDDSTGFNSRIVPMAGVVADQLDLYCRHRQALASRLLLLAPEFAIAIIQGDQRDASIDYAAHPSARLVRFISLRRGRLVVSAVGGARLLERMGPDFSWFRLPSNCNRHYLRSRLLADGCPVAHVDYFMGHWGRGREPLARFASLPLRTYLDDVRHRLEQILADDGWQAVAGLA